jgi:glycerate kinase
MPDVVIVAPNSFKGSVSAEAAARAMARGVRAVFAGAEIVELPVADGGEGTVEALVASGKGRIEERTVRGPLGEPVRAKFGIIGETAVVEMAAASGLTLTERRDPRAATTYGTGELIRAALDAGAKRIIVGLGGSATSDGGAGMARALGARFLDASGSELPEGGAALAKLARIDLSGFDPGAAEIVLACDVDNPLTGPRGASAVYGPQKGATPEMVRELDAALAHYASVARQATGRNVADIPGAGAAGGLGAGFLFFTKAQLRPGAEIVLEAVHFAEHLKRADIVITGEGRTDAQSAMGKAPGAVARLCRKHGVPVICLSGGLGKGAEDLDVDALLSIVPGPMTLEECMARGEELIEAGAARVCRLLRAGLLLHSRNAAFKP